MGGEEFINGIERYCLWLVDCPPALLRMLRLVQHRVELNRKYRLQSGREVTKSLALVPSLFGEIRQPESPFLLVPKVSSENRRFIQSDSVDVSRAESCGLMEISLARWPPSSVRTGRLLCRRGGSAAAMDAGSSPRRCLRRPAGLPCRRQAPGLPGSNLRPPPRPARPRRRSRRMVRRRRHPRACRGRGRRDRRPGAGGSVGAEPVCDVGSGASHRRPDERSGTYPALAEAAIGGVLPGSSAGGEQPKFGAIVGTASGPEHVLVKFSPAVVPRRRTRRGVLAAGGPGPPDLGTVQGDRACERRCHRRGRRAIHVGPCGSVAGGPGRPAFHRVTPCCRSPRPCARTRPPSSPSPSPALPSPRRRASPRSRARPA